MPEALVAGVNLSRVFGEGRSAVSAIDEATFEVSEGDRIALIGPSGSGKSTLLHLIAGLDRPTGGLIQWPALGGWEDLRPGRVSFAFQGPSLLPPLTVEENVALPVLLVGGPEEQARKAARAMIERLDLQAVAGKLPEELSGGQSQRAGLARALVGEPRLVLADEPTGQQDRASSQRVIDFLLERTEEIGTALIVATHDQAVAERFPIHWWLESRRLNTEVGLRSA
jgi:putative ABC transport system ATP-binding protein/lipoprotein-releasing system ATP-binding protein